MYRVMLGAAQDVLDKLATLGGIDITNKGLHNSQGRLVRKKTHLIHVIPIKR